MHITRSSLARLVEPGSFQWLAGIEDTFITAPSAKTGRTLDEYALTGHYARWREDLELFTQLRVPAVRYGIPWHRINPAPGTWDFACADGPLERLLSDPSISEIMVNGPHDIWIERQGRLSETTLRFTDASHLRRIITKMVGQVGRRIDESSPLVDARLPDGSRVNAVIPPLSLSGPLLTIRKFRQDRFDIAELVQLGAGSVPDHAAVLEVKGRLVGQVLLQVLPQLGHLVQGFAKPIQEGGLDPGEAGFESRDPGQGLPQGREIFWRGHSGSQAARDPG